MWVAEKKVMRLGKCMLAPQGCIFMNVNPQSMANSADTIRRDHLQGDRDGNTLVYLGVMNMHELVTTVRGKTFFSTGFHL